MNPTLLKNAVLLVPETELLVNMVRLRVRQLIRGHRALILAPPGMGHADIALSEIGAGKLISEATGDSAPVATPPVVIAFPKAAPTKKAA